MKKSSKLTYVAQSIPNIPWQDRPAGCIDTIWRYDANPVIPRNLIPCSNSIFNSAVVPYKGKFVGVFRVDDKRRASRLHFGRSDDGLNWNIDNDPIKLTPENKRVKEVNSSGIAHGYDPRVVLIDDRYWITWCSGNHGPTIGVAWTRDFRKYYQVEHAFLPYNRNGVLFPRKINGKYVMLSRPSDNDHTLFGDIFLSESPDMVYWGCHRHVMAKGLGWGWLKIGAGPIPIETSEGWLLIYHGVCGTCSGFIYSIGAALLDRNDPSQVIVDCENYLLTPEEPYETTGFVPNVAFPCATLQDSATGRIAIFYGAADTYCALAFTQVDELIAYIKANPNKPM
jgi:beta-1,4-mannooligosaccharide/beta-1,4-mannosyl-N-acetylglucosamine phosphorylase